MGKICVSPIAHNDGTTQARIAWSWNTSVHIAVFHHTENKFQLHKQYRHKLKFGSCYEDNYEEMLEGFCDAIVRLAFHENDLIVAVDSHGEKTASSFIHILDIATGNFLWKYQGIHWYKCRCKLLTV